MLVDSRALAPTEAVLSEAEKARRERMRISQHGIVEYHWDEEGKFILVPVDGNLYLADRRSAVFRSCGSPIVKWARLYRVATSAWNPGDIAVPAPDGLAQGADRAEASGQRNAACTDSELLCRRAWIHYRGGPLWRV